MLTQAQPRARARMFIKWHRARPRQHLAHWVQKAEKQPGERGEDAARDVDPALMHVLVCGPAACTDGGNVVHGQQPHQQDEEQDEQHLGVYVCTYVCFCPAPAPFMHTCLYSHRVAQIHTHMAAARREARRAAPPLRLRDKRSPGSQLTTCASQIPIPPDIRTNVFQMQLHTHMSKHVQTCQRR